MTPGLAHHDVGAAAQIGGHDRVGGDVAAADVLGQGAGDHTVWGWVGHGILWARAGSSEG